MSIESSVRNNPENFRFGRVELVPQHINELGPDIFSLELIVDGRKVGDVDYSYDTSEKEISIDWQFIFEHERGKGYGRLTSDALYEYVMSKHPNAAIIMYSTDHPAVAHIMLKTPVPEGWERHFKLF